MHVGVLSDWMACIISILFRPAFSVPTRALPTVDAYFRCLYVCTAFVGLWMQKCPPCFCCPGPRLVKLLCLCAIAGRAAKSQLPKDVQLNFTYNYNPPKQRGCLALWTSPIFTLRSLLLWRLLWKPIECDKQHFDLQHYSRWAEIRALDCILTSKSARWNVDFLLEAIAVSYKSP